LHAAEIYTFLGLQYFVILTLLTWLSQYLERGFPQYS
jgi:ABC-type amino acid transport system permease subunit